MQSPKGDFTPKIRGQPSELLEKQATNFSVAIYTVGVLSFDGPEEVAARGVCSPGQAGVS